MKHISFIDFIKFPMAFLVVYAHAPGKLTMNYGEQCNTLLLSLQALNNFLVFLATVSMRGFFVISGFLFFRNIVKWDFEVISKKIKKRCLLYIPSYLLWSTLYVLLVCFLYHKGLFELFNEKGLLNIYVGFDNIDGLQIKTFPYLYPMWYVRDLIITFLISPILYLIIRISPWGLLVIFIFQIFVTIPTSAFFFFSIGIFLALYGTSITPWLSGKYIKVIVFIITAFWIITKIFRLTEWNVWEEDFLCSAVTMLAVFLLTKDLQLDYLNKFGKCSYFIFAYHPFFIEVYLKIYYTKLSTLSLDLTLFYELLYLIFPIPIYYVGYYLDKFIKKHSTLLGRYLCAG